VLLRNRQYIIILIFILLYCNSSYAQQWRMKTNLTLSSGYDNNVFESLDSSQTDCFSRLMIDSGVKTKLFKTVTLNLNYQGGAELYKRYSIENRTINHFGVLVNLPVYRGLSAGVRIKQRVKTFFKGENGYNHFHGMAFLQWSLRYGLRTIIFYSQSKLDYVHGNNYDYHCKNGGLRFEMAISPKIHLEIQYSSGSYGYDRQALDYEKLDSLVFIWYGLGTAQRDRLQEISATLDVYWWALFRCGFSYLENRSNSYGYSYKTPIIRIVTAKSLAGGFLLRILWNFQIKKYSDSLQPILTLRPDTENEENNVILFDLVKDISKKISLQLRIGLYKNESPYRDLYYQKSRIALGMTYRFQK